MKIIKIYIALLFIALTACEDDPRPIYNDDVLGEFVRFAVQLDKNNGFVDGVIEPTHEFVDRYKHGKFSSISIPVAISSSGINSEISVDYTVERFGDFEDFEVSPSQLTFNSEKLYDTIQVDFTSRWDTLVRDSIVLQLTKTSDPALSIGYPFGEFANKTFSILLETIVLPYTIPTPNNFALNGKQGESISFTVEFTNGLIASDLENIEILLEENSDFKYTLTHDPVKTGDTEVNYTLTILEELDNDLKYYSCEFSLAEIEGYDKFGNTSIKFEKFPTNLADNKLNTARHFYDVAYDAFNRLYTLFYIDRFKTGCNWYESSQFVVPVSVSRDHPNAVLHEDGNYYHAFQIGFKPTNPGRTTNSFGLKSWFDNEYTDEDKSPGFNIKKALEFYPKDGTSATEGTVSVIKQDLLIAARGTENQYTISIAGEGTYHYEANSYQTFMDSIFILDMVLEVTHEALLGGTIKMPYKFMNRNPEKEERPTSTFDTCHYPVKLE